MIDANSQFFAILTNVGMAKQANADALGIAWKLTEMGVGDANPGGLADPPNPIPSAAQAKLLNEWRRKPLNQLRVDPVNSAVIIAEQVIPADEGGKWIREIGLYDADGDLVAVANCAPSFKPLLSQGSGRTQVVRMNFVVTSAGNITLKIDPAVVLATREYVDSRILEELYKLDNKQSVRVASTANIALSGLQSIDGVVLAAGDRVLVKNQTSAKDNGIYVVPASGPWVRAADADSNAEVTSALLVSVEQGATLADTRWQLITDGVIVLGATALTFQNVTQGFAPINSPALINPMANTPPQFDVSQKVATTEFVQRAVGNFSGFSQLTSSITLTPASAGGYYRFSLTANSTCTLPNPSTVPAGSRISIQYAAGSTYLLTVAVASGFISGPGTNGDVKTSLKFPVGIVSQMEFVSDGVGAWTACNGSFGCAAYQNGFEPKPNGLMDQWGYVTYLTGGPIQVVFPTSFESSCFSVVANRMDSIASTGTILISSVTKSGFTFFDTAGPANDSNAIYWMAKGK